MSPDNDSRNPRSNRKPSREKKRGGDKLGFGDYRFLRVEFTAAEREEFNSFLEGDEFPPDVVDALLRSGLSVKHSLVDNFKTYLVTATDNRPASENAGFTVSARSGDKRTAECGLYYKIIYLLGDEPWEAVQDSRGGAYHNID